MSLTEPVDLGLGYPHQAAQPEESSTHHDAALRAPNLDADLDEYERHERRRGLRPNSLRQHRAHATRHYRQWGTWAPDEDALLRWLQQHNGWTAVTYYSQVNALYRWLVDTGRAPANPLADVPRPPCPRPRPQPLTEDEITAALKLAGPESNLYAWINLGNLAGLRAHEIAKFRGRDITQRDIVVAGKGGVVDSVPTHPKLWLLAQRFPADDYWFPSPLASRPHVSTHHVSYTTSLLFDRLGIRGSIHRTRHSYGTRLLRNGENIRVVQRLMRHSSLAVTSRYLGVDDDELRDAINRLAA